MTGRDVVRTHRHVPMGSAFTVSAGHPMLAELDITDVPDDATYVVLLHPDDERAPEVAS